MQEIFLNWSTPWGFIILGTGVTYSRFQSDGYVEAFKQLLIIRVTGVARKMAHSFRNMSGMSIGNVDLVFLVLVILLKTLNSLT